MKLKRILSIILLYIGSINCSTYTTTQMEYVSGPGCGPSYSCPSYCGVYHKHCKNLNKIEQKDSTKVKEDKND